MNIELTSRHYEPSDRVKEHVNKELTNLSEFENLISKCKVILEKTKDGETITLTLHVSGKDMISTECTDDMVKSIDSAVEKMGRQLRKFKDKRISH
ncbi:MAG: ribosomal subunit interface protein [Candidatus Marinimicrobia bacterium CG08_land_8_20_14_0_20_45_22]|nr:MAG: ribosomal subunit interface protein [Candidatus Marinimicrobia bacterium CG08_land_8_20_14_0_20_45_22]